MSRAVARLAIAWGLLELPGCAPASKTDGASVLAPARPPDATPAVVPDRAPTPSREALLAEECARSGRRAVAFVALLDQQRKVRDLRERLEQLDRDEDDSIRSWEAGRLRPGALARDHPAIRRTRARHEADLERADAELARLQALLDELDRRRPAR